MRTMGFVIFLAGVGLSGVFAARHVVPELPEGQAELTPGDRIGAWWDEAGLGFSVGAIMMIAGGLVARRARGPSSTGPTGESDTESVPALMKAIRDRLDGLPEDGKASGEELKEGLDEILEELVPRVLDRREAMIEDMGLGRFAEMIGHFASMERNAARAWSALIDESFEEIPPSLERARDGIRQVIAALGRAA